MMAAIANKVGSKPHNAFPERFAAETTSVTTKAATAATIAATNPPTINVADAM